MVRRAAAAALMLLVAACGGDDAGDTTTAAATEAPATTAAATTAAPTTAAAAAATTTTAPASTTTTSTSTTTTTTAAPAPATLAMTRVVFEPSSYVVITNVGGVAAELGDHWLCAFPAYQQLPAQTLEAGESVAVGLDDTEPPELVDFVAVLSLGTVLGVPDTADGELALYTSPDFGSPAAILDYVEWGSTDHTRSSVAAEAGIWSPGAFIEIPEEAFAISSSGAIGANEADWFVDLGG